MSYHFILKKFHFAKNVRFHFDHLILIQKRDGIFYIPCIKELEILLPSHSSKQNIISFKEGMRSLLTISDPLKITFCESFNLVGPEKKVKLSILNSKGDYLTTDLDHFINETPFNKNINLINQSSIPSEKRTEFYFEPSFLSYQGMIVSSLLEKVKPYLTEHRFKHSVSVATLCYKIAYNNRFDHPERAYIAGLLHDIGKKLDVNTSKQLMKKEFSDFLSYPDWSLHQFVGCVLSKRDFRINDSEILDAICFHCTGKAKMCSIGEILYSADKIDPLRGWNSGNFIEICLRDYHLGFLETLKANKKFLKEKMGNDEIDCELSRNCYRYYLGEE